MTDNNDRLRRVTVADGSSLKSYLTVVEVIDRLDELRATAHHEAAMHRANIRHAWLHRLGGPAVQLLAPTTLDPHDIRTKICEIRVKRRDRTYRAYRKVCGRVAFKSMFKIGSPEFRTDEMQAMLSDDARFMEDEQTLRILKLRLRRAKLTHLVLFVLGFNVHGYR